VISGPSSWLSRYRWFRQFRGSGVIHRVGWEWGSLWLGLVLFGAVAVLLLVDPLHWSSSLDHTCDQRGFTCGLGIHLLGTVIGAIILFLLSYLVVFRASELRVTRRLRRIARSKPKDLFELPPPIEVSEIIGRDHLYAEIGENMKGRFRAGPQIVVGTAGSGKTAALIGLAKFLAQRGVVPILLSLRGVQEVGLDDLARRRFLKLAESMVASEERSKAVWRWLCQRERVAVLGDDLDAADVERSRVREALETASLPVVLTSRPEGIPDGSRASVLPLKPLERKAVVEYIARRAEQPPPPGTREQVAGVVHAGELHETPFYVSVAVALVKEARLPRASPASSTPAKVAIRVKLLNAYRQGLLDGKVGPQAGFSTEEREVALEELTGLALCMVLSEQGGLDALAGGLKRPDKVNGLRLEVAGERLGLLESSDGTRSQFKHQILRSYFASLRLKSDTDLWRALNGELSRGRILPLSPALLITLVFASCGSAHADDGHVVAQSRTKIFSRLVAGSGLARDDGNLSEATGASLLQHSRLHLVPEEWAEEERLLSITAAAQIASALRTDTLEREVARAAIGARATQSSELKNDLLSAVRGLHVTEKYLALWDYAKDDSYVVRWRAVEALVDEGREAYLTLKREHIRKLLADAEREVRKGNTFDDWEDPVAPLKTLGWLLPSLRTALLRRDGGTTKRHESDQKHANAVGADIKRLMALLDAGITQQLGLEASIAQGFKLDATRSLNVQGHRDPHVEVDPWVLDRLTRRHPEFWYARLVLVHALAARVPWRRLTSPELKAIKDACSDNHPYVREAARLCKPARHRRTISRFIWEDEGQVVASRPAALAPRASQLVADVTILLNLNERRGVEPDVEYWNSRLAFGASDELPLCLNTSNTRHELLGDGCPSQCTFARFHFCPYRHRLEGRSARRELSKAFCRYQRYLAGQRIRRRGRTGISGKELARFWAKMEEWASA
jgi:hypothetical protein